MHRSRVSPLRPGVLAVLAFAAALFLASVAAVKPMEHHGSAAPANPLVARGLYLTTIMACNDCHTPGTLYGAPDFSRKLSGAEMGWRGPWGISFARNLTPDAETGLGNWTEADIVRALRTGVKKDGRALLPPMPWQNWTGLTDADAKAIAAYLKSLPPVKHKVHDVVAPGAPFNGTVLEFPPPTAWDVPPAGPGAGAGAAGK